MDKKVVVSKTKTALNNVSTVQKGLMGSEKPLGKKVFKGSVPKNVLRKRFF